VFTREGIERFVPQCAERGGHGIDERAVREAETGGAERVKDVARWSLKFVRQLIDTFAIDEKSVEERHGAILPTGAAVCNCCIITMTAGSLNPATMAPTESVTCSIFLLLGHPS